MSLNIEISDRAKGYILKNKGVLVIRKTPLGGCCGGAKDPGVNICMEENIPPEDQFNMKEIGSIIEYLTINFVWFEEVYLLKFIKRFLAKLEKTNQEQFGDNKKLDCCDLNQQNGNKEKSKNEISKDRKKEWGY